MVLCKYFMEGYCKYGSRCRFQHDVYDGYEASRDRNNTAEERSSGISILKGSSASYSDQSFNQANSSTFGGNVFNSGNGNNSHFSEQFANQGRNSSFGVSTFSHGNSSQGFNPMNSSTFFSEQSFNQNNTSTYKAQNNYQQNSLLGTSKFNIQELMDVVSKDVLMSERGNQWPLSAYSPHKDLPNLPGVDDHMPEELRWECYKASQNSSLPLYQAIMQQLYSNVAKINNDLKKKDTAYAIINTWLQNVKKIHETPMASPFDGGNLVQGKTQTYSQPSNDGSFTFSLPHQTTPVQPHSDDVSVLGGSKPVFGSRQNFNSLINLTLTDNQAYSEMEQLTEKDLEAFKADSFVLGSIPTKSPPKVLCNL